jgi:hypothetical protein
MGAPFEAQVRLLVVGGADDGALHGAPTAKYLRRAIDARPFDRWPVHFEEMAREVCPARVTRSNSAFLAKGKRDRLSAPA